MLNLQHYNKNYKIDTEKIETWEKASFCCPPESSNLAFIESPFRNPPPTKIVSMYLFFQSSRLHQASEIQLLKNQGEQEGTQILTIVMLSL